MKSQKKAHKDKKDKAGKDCIFHPVTVASTMDTDTEKAVAYLYSSITFEAYISRVCQNPVARKLKMVDLMHNCNLSRIENPTEKDFERCEK